MALRILYFASLRETIGSSGESLELPAGCATVGQLRTALAERHAVLLTAKNLRCAVNQRMANMEDAVADGDEVAFFPPVTGG